MRVSLLTVALLALRVGLAIQPGAAPGATPDPALEAGRRLYEQGLQADGRPLRAAAAGGVTLEGNGAACIACHRRSGEGGREGESRIAPITGPALYSKPSFHQPGRPGERARPIVPPRRDARSAYDDATLARAIRSGLDADGHPLDALMPRYALGDADAQALVAWLRQLGAGTEPGVGPGQLRLATVVAGDVDPVRRAAFLSALRAWSARGAVSGLETPLDVWTLQGPPASWHAQLSALQSRQPAFAVVSGLAGNGWEEVQSFCEDEALPCLFPLLDFAPEPRPAGHAYLLSSGAQLEARALAAWLDSAGHPPVRQLADGPAGLAAAAQFTSSYGASASSDAPDTAAMDAGAHVLVAWVGPAAAREAMRDLPRGTLLYLSGQLAPPAALEVPVALRSQVRWISSRVDPVRVHALARVEADPWLQSLGVEPVEDALAVELRLATWLVDDALARMRGHWRREYLLECIESGMQAPESARLFEGFSRAPGQRLLVRGARVLGWPDAGGAAPVALGSLLLP